MARKQKQYVGSIRLTDKARPVGNTIPAGIPFSKSIMVKHTFDKLLKQGYITEVVPGKRPSAPVKVKRNKALAVGLPRETPDAAIHPIKTKKTVQGGVHTEETANPVEESAETIKAPAEVPATQTEAPKEEDKRDALQVLKDEKSAKATQAPVEKTNTAVWTYNPADLKGLPLMQLLDIYKKRHAEFFPEQELKVFRHVDDVRAYLSSEFGK
jgi:hypothetical protein